jgi:ABC-type phosphate/phosphonate transport system permease subunit
MWDDLVPVAVVALLAAFCIALPLAFWASSRPHKERKRTMKDDYPDDHLFV